MKEKILEALYQKKGSYISGEELAEKFNVSRTAIWKQMNLLKKSGHKIETANKKGYRIVASDEKLVAVELIQRLETKVIGQKMICLDTIDSTNNYAKKIAQEAEDGTVVISDEQVGGRGRLGRNWSSPKGEGIWMSIILKPDIPPTEGSKMTQIAAAAVCQAIRATTGLDVLIKWPNDIILNGKKVCGILTEMSGELNQVEYIIVGIGVNVNIKAFPEEILEKATSLYLEKKQVLQRKELILSILQEFEKLFENYTAGEGLASTIEVCRKYSAMIGKEIRLIQGNREESVLALDITEDGILKIKRENGQEDLILSGEVSIRGKNGYI